MINELIPKLIRAALNNDKKNVEAISLAIGRKLKKEDPKTSSEIMKVLSYSSIGSDVMRSIDLPSVPVDKETRYQLVKLEEPLEIVDPILADATFNELQDFLAERNMIEKFLQENIVPSNSILLYGKPGVGKTYIAKWMAYKMNMPMVTLDLANSISSYLGRSGQNIKSIFQYTKEQQVLLFLDEIDAIAKRRDDASDLGELKRLVNVLLKELEECPVTCVIIGATNHPELLDKAIWRRFDRNIEVGMPEMSERKKILERNLAQWSKIVDDDIILLIAEETSGKSAADICKICEHIKRKIILYPDRSPDECALLEFCENINIESKESKIRLCKGLKKCGKKMTLKKMSELTGFSQSAIDRYLKE